MTVDVGALLAEPLRHDWGATRARVSSAGGASSAEGAMARAEAMARALPPSVEGHGGDDALWHAARELATILPEDAPGVAAVLVGVYGPRCLPPWPVDVLERQARRAVAETATPEARWSRRAEARRASGGVVAGGIPPGGVHDWTRPCPPIAWYCEGLAIAPSESKITLIGGESGAGKGPLADYIGACFALGRPLFGVHAVRRCNVGLLDFEGAALTARRIESHARGLGVAPAELAGRLLLRDSHPGEMIDLAWLAAWVQEHAIEVLIVDSYMTASAGRGDDPNGPAFAGLAQDLGRLGIVVICVAHSRKPAKGSGADRPTLGDIAGSYALGGMAQTGIAVWHPDPDDRTLARVGCMRAPVDAFRAFSIRWEHGVTTAGDTWTPAIVPEDTRPGGAVTAHDAALTRAAGVMLDLMRRHPGHPVSVSGIARASGLPGGIAGEALAALTRAGWAHYQPDGSGRTAGAYTLAHTLPARISFRGGEATTETASADD